ncbi:MAG: transcriptional regulator [Parvibaculum sp.]|uniref:transcriptional regulator n=1 Tax=Parvibaculum sp. TaxID=2024848 RepID=UPI002728C383|nr:transcriptional regulator [Parvibaculum sp.]MDO8837983.1 transcriptional regulator [Parvibaculum sp.]
MNPHRIKAEKAWGAPLTDWLDVLVEECAKSSQNRVGKKLQVSSTVVSRVIGNTYEGDVEKFADRVRGTYLAATVICPVLGEIGRQRCVAEQGKKLTFENPQRPRLYQACRGGCPNSRLGDGK